MAHTDATVLILGETGTGKELLAKAIHFNSLRRERPFVVINCGAIPAELLESELFGHVKGSFTGAMTHKKGKVEIAEGGTLFLDEIGEMSLDLQMRVLRLLQEREIEKVGATKLIRVDVRIIAATHRNLETLVAEGEIPRRPLLQARGHSDLLPPLRDRAGDIPELIHQFFDRSRQKHNRPDLALSPAAMPYLVNYRWPGNVRELENVIERLVLLCRSDEVGGLGPSPQHPSAPSIAGGRRRPLPRYRGRIERSRARADREGAAASPTGIRRKPRASWRSAEKHYCTGSASTEFRRMMARLRSRPEEERRGNVRAMTPGEPESPR